MDAYLDLHLLPDQEFVPNLLLSALYSKLHRGLVTHGAHNIGISFPGVGKHGLGTHLRLHGTAAALQGLMAQNWLTGMRDHITVGQVLAVPSAQGYRVVRRVQVKSNAERLRRRLMARKGLTEEQARQTIPDSAAERTDLPYVTLKSQTTGQQFRLFIEHLPIQNTPVAGAFGTYGLGRIATVPWF